MANFQAACTSAISSNGGTFVITDTSNYTTNSEDGHNLAEFTLFQVVTATDNTGTVYYFATTEGATWLSSVMSITANGTITNPPATALTFDFNYPIPLVVGDGVYVFNNYTIPTYDGGAAYNATSDMVYYNGAVWKCIQSGTGFPPDINPLYWTAITDLSLIFAKYNGENTNYRIFDEQAAYDNLAFAMGCNASCNSCDDDVIKATKLLHNLNAIANKASYEDWTNVAWLISIGKELETCGC